MLFLENNSHTDNHNNNIHRCEPEMIVLLDHVVLLDLGSSSSPSSCLDSTPVVSLDAHTMHKHKHKQQHEQQQRAITQILDTWL